MKIILHICPVYHITTLLRTEKFEVFSLQAWKYGKLVIEQATTDTLY